MQSSWVEDLAEVHVKTLQFIFITRDMEKVVTGSIPVTMVDGGLDSGLEGFIVQVSLIHN